MYSTPALDLPTNSLLAIFVSGVQKYRRIAKNIVGNDSDADEVIGRCNLKIWKLECKRTPIAFHDNAHKERFLNRLVINESIDLVRLLRRSKTPETNVVSWLLEQDQEDRRCHGLNAAEQRIAIDEILSSTTDEERALLSLYAESYTHGEISKRMNRSIGRRATSYHIKSVLEFLKERFGDAA